MTNRITEQPFCQTRVSGSTFVNADCFDVFPFIEDKSIGIEKGKQYYDVAVRRASQYCH
jgi:hypothetical protein